MRFTVVSRALMPMMAALVVASPSLAPAHAAPARTCQLLRDASGDAGLDGGEGSLGVIPGTEEPSLDVISADVATDATRLTAVIRVAKLEYGPEPMPYGGSWSFHFASPESAFFLDAARTYDGDYFYLAHYLTDYVGDSSQSYAYEVLGPVTGVIDQDRSEIRITAPLSMLAPHDKISEGSVLTKLLVMTWFEQSLSQEVLGSTGSQADETPGGRSPTYRAGSRSCVKVGA